MQRPLASVHQVLLESLDRDSRRVLSAWRTLIYLRRATFELDPSRRRWKNLPENESDTYPYIRQMVQRGELREIENARRLYRPIVPFASDAPIDEREVLFEAHPYTVLSHLSALEFHHLTWDQPKIMTTMSAAKMPWDFLPLGTTIEDWEGVELPARSKPAKVLQIPVDWKDLPPGRIFGIETYERHRVPYRVTSPERTLLDTLQDPGRSGGIMNVLKAWGMARETMDVETILTYTELYGIALLRQRVGYILEELNVHHPTLDRWSKASKRGGSSKLVGTEPFSPTYSERWNISLNAPVHILSDDE